MHPTDWHVFCCFTVMHKSPIFTALWSSSVPKIYLRVLLQVHDSELLCLASAKEGEPWEGGCCLLCSSILDVWVLLCRGWMWHSCPLGSIGHTDHPFMSGQGNSLSWDAMGTEGWHGFKRHPGKLIAKTHMEG